MCDGCRDSAGFVAMIDDLLDVDLAAVIDRPLDMALFAGRNAVSGFD